MGKHESRGEERSTTGREASATATTTGAPPSRLRVLVIAPSIRILGGQAVQAARLIASLAGDSSLQVDFLPINPRLPGALGRLQGIKYVRTVVTTLAFIRLLLIRAGRCDVLHIFSASYASFVMQQTPALIVARLYGKPAILNYHSGEAGDHLTRWRRTAIPTLRLASRIVVPSDYLVEVFREFGLEAEAIFNIVETERFPFRPRAHLRPIFLANRNFEIHYNVAMVLRAFALVQERYPHAELTIAGDGSQRVALERLAEELELKQTRFLGAVPPTRMPELYDKADIYLNGSEIDNMPLSILESFAAGVPVVTTNAGGIPYIVEDGRTGLLVECGDVQAMAQMCFRLLEDAELTKRLTLAAFAECAKYTATRTSAEWTKLYRELVVEGQAKGGAKDGVREREPDAAPAAASIARADALHGEAASAVNASVGERARAEER